MKKLSIALLLSIFPCGYAIAGFSPAGGGSVDTSALVQKAGDTMTGSLTSPRFTINTSTTGYNKVQFNVSNPNPKGCITFSTDDGYAANYTVLMPTCVVLGIRPTVYVTTNLLESALYLSSAQVTELSTVYNFEIGSHGSTHATFTGDDAATNLQCSTSKLVLETLTGKPCISLAYPQGVNGNGSRVAVAKYFNNARGTVEDPIVKKPVDVYQIGSHNLDSASLAVLYTAVDSATLQGGIASFYCHNMDNSSGGALDKLYKITLYAQSKGLEVLPMTEALEKYGNVFGATSNTTGLTTGLGQNGKMNIEAGRVTFLDPAGINTSRIEMGYDATYGLQIQSFSGDLKINSQGNNTYIQNPYLQGEVIYSGLTLTANTIDLYGSSSNQKEFINLDATTGNKIVYLGTGSDGKTIEFKKVDITTNTITIYPRGSTLIDISTVTMRSPYETLTLKYLNSQWWAYNHYYGEGTFYTRDAVITNSLTVGTTSNISAIYMASGITISTSNALSTANNIVLVSSDGVTMLGVDNYIPVPFNFTLNEIIFDFGNVSSTGSIRISTASAGTFPSATTGTTYSFSGVTSSATVALSGIGTTYTKGSYIRAIVTSIAGVTKQIYVTLLGNKLP